MEFQLNFIDMSVFLMWTCVKLFNMFNIFPSHFLGFSVGSNRSFSILGLLGACTVCRCNQRHSPWKMAVFLMCLFIDNDKLGLRGRAIDKWYWSQQQGLKNSLDNIWRKQTDACGLIILFLGLKCTIWQHNSALLIIQGFQQNPRENNEIIVQKLLTLFFSYS